MDAIAVLVGAVVMALAVELQRAAFRSSYLEMTELLRGLGDSPSGVAVGVRVLVMPAVIAFVIALIKPPNAGATGFAVAVMGNAFVVWRGLVEPPPIARANVITYRLLVLGFLALSGVAGWAGGSIASALFCSGPGPCNLSSLVGTIVLPIALGVVSAVLAEPLVAHLYRRRR